MPKITFPIIGMHCRSCEVRIEQALLDVPGVASVTIRRTKNEAAVTYDKQRPDEGQLAAAVASVGYRVGVAQQEPYLERDPRVYFETALSVAVLFLFFIVGKATGILDFSLGTSLDIGGYPFVFVLGLAAGVSTCMALIGGLTLGLAARFSERHPEASTQRKFEPHLFFNLGRIGGFAILGFLLGLFGELIAFSERSLGTLSLLAGIAMLFVGIQLVGLFPRFSRVQIALPKRLAKFLPARNGHAGYSRRRAAFLGALTFFLPCGFTQSVQLLVIASGSPIFGAVALPLFALGTAPGLLALGGVTAAVPLPYRRAFFRFAGVLVVLFAAVNLSGAMNLLALGSAPAVPATIPDSREPDRIIRIEQRADGYYPAQVMAREGERVRLVFDSKDSFSCATSLLIPALGVRSVLTPGENPIDFTAESVGTIPYSCSMGMYRGEIIIE